MGNKRLNYIRIFGLTLVCFGLTICCNKKKTQSVQQTNRSKDTSKSKIMDIKFNDTVFQNIQFNGAIKYDMKLDSLKKSDISYRGVIFFASIFENSQTFEQIGKTAFAADVIDSVIVDGVHIFNFSGKFKNSGIDTVRIAVEDVIIPKGDTTKETINISKGYSFLSLPVTVIDSNLVAGYKGDTIYFVGERMVKVKRKDSAKYAKENQREIDSMKRVLNYQ